jgi:hypothetical protein
MMRALMPHEIHRGGSYWAPWGDSGWSAVVVQRLGHKRARVERVNPRTLEAADTKGWARLDEMVKRDPKAKGKDRPTTPHEELFRDSRVLRLKKAISAPAQPVADEPKDLASPEERLARTDRALALLPDQFKEEDW